MSKPVLFADKAYMPLSSLHDLSKGERSYLEEHGIKPRDFDKLDAISQNEWREECKEPAYESMRKFEKRKI